MRIRLMGTTTELATVLPVLREVLDVQEESDPYPNRGNSTLVRVYLEVQPRRGGDQPATHGADDHQE